MKNGILNKIERGAVVCKGKKHSSDIMQYHLSNINTYSRDHEKDVARGDYVREKFYEKSMEIVSRYLATNRSEIPDHFFNGGILEVSYLNFEIDASSHTVEVSLHDKIIGSFIFNF